METHCWVEGCDGLQQQRPHQAPLLSRTEMRQQWTGSQKPGQMSAGLMKLCFCRGYRWLDSGEDNLFVFVTSRLHDWNVVHNWWSPTEQHLPSCIAALDEARWQHVSAWSLWWFYHFIFLSKHFHRPTSDFLTFLIFLMVFFSSYYLQKTKMYL